MLSKLDAQELYCECVRATRDYVQDAGFTDVVIGLSGGIDSSLVATIAVDALCACSVHGVMLPGPFSSGHSLVDAQRLAENLGISSCIIDITEPYEAFMRELDLVIGRNIAGLSSENLQARCRTVALMALSNECGWLMLNTGNKSEAAMGYSTLYGDMAGAFAPIGGIYKTDVFELARYRNSKAEADGSAPPIPQQIIDKPPSAELREGQTDEESLGISYEDLDKILVAGEGIGMERASLIDAGYDERQVGIALAGWKRSAFKRMQEPPTLNADIY